MCGDVAGGPAHVPLVVDDVGVRTFDSPVFTSLEDLVLHFQGRSILHGEFLTLTYVTHIHTHTHT
jgi:hypothetical protein